MTDDFYQQAFMPPRVVEVVARIGVIVDADHAQAQIEVWEPATKVQLALRSLPHYPMERYAELVQRVCEDFHDVAIEAPDQHHPF